jgi:hypothetical protein
MTLTNSATLQKPQKKEEQLTALMISLRQLPFDRAAGIEHL